MPLGRHTALVVHGGRRLAEGAPAEALLDPLVRATPGIGLPAALAIGVALRDAGLLAVGDPLPVSTEDALAMLRARLAAPR